MFPFVDDTLTCWRLSDSLVKRALLLLLADASSNVLDTTGCGPNTALELLSAQLADCELKKFEWRGEKKL